MLVLALVAGAVVGALAIAVFTFVRRRAATVRSSSSGSKLIENLVGVIATGLWLLICSFPVVVFLYFASIKVEIVITELHQRSHTAI